MTAATNPRKSIAEVVTIIGRHRARVDEVERAVREAWQPERPVLWPPHPLTKDDKRAARSIASALERLEKTLGFKSFQAVIYRAAHDDFQEWKAQLKTWRRRFEAFAGDLRTEGPTFLSRDREGWPLGHASKSTEALVRKRRAVEAAVIILKAHNLPLTVTRISGTRGGSVFCRVAAAIYGKRADLSYQCRQARKRGSR